MPKTDLAESPALPRTGRRDLGLWSTCESPRPSRPRRPTVRRVTRSPLNARPATGGQNSLVLTSSRNTSTEVNPPRLLIAPVPTHVHTDQGAARRRLRDSRQSGPLRQESPGRRKSHVRDESRRCPAHLGQGKHRRDSGGELLHAIMAGIAEFYSRNLGTEPSRDDAEGQTGRYTWRAPIGYLMLRSALRVVRYVQSRSTRSERRSSNGRSSSTQPASGQ